LNSQPKVLKKFKMIYLSYFLIALGVLFLLFFPFIPVGGNYYRGLLLIYHKYDWSGNSPVWSPRIPMLEIVWWADPFTFRHFEAGYATDRRYVYTGQRIDNSDSKTFHAISSPDHSDKHFDRFYVDKNAVRWGEVRQVKFPRLGQPPENFDAETFAPLGAGFSRDKTGVYYHINIGGGSEKNYYQRYQQSVGGNQRADIVDAETFRIIEFSRNRCRAADKNFLYHAKTCCRRGVGRIEERGTLQIIKALGAEPFEDLGCDYYKTRRGVFYRDLQIYQADAETFQVLPVAERGYCLPYAKDKNYVYYEFQLMKDADPVSFQVVETPFHFSFDRKSRFSREMNFSEFSESRERDENKKFEEEFKKWKEIQSENSAK